MIPYAVIVIEQRIHQLVKLHGYRIMAYVILYYTPGKNISIPLTYAQYKKYMGEDNLIRMTGLCEVEGTEERILLEKDINLVLPPITIKVRNLTTYP